MPDWREEFLSGIRANAQNNPVNRELVDACSQLADQISALEAEKKALELKLSKQQETSSPPPTKGAPNPSSTTTNDATTAPGDPSSTTTDNNNDDSSTNNNSALVAQLRLQLAEALRSKGQFQTRLQNTEDELMRLRSRTSTDARTIRDLTAERRILSIKLRDREEELRAKNKLVADVQDELAVLNMQLNLVEKRYADKVSENKQLVERFMKRVGQEADAMNREFEPPQPSSRKR